MSEEDRCKQKCLEACKYIQLVDGSIEGLENTLLGMLLALYSAT